MEELMLARHGTAAYLLPPTAIVAAAISDIKARVHNQAVVKASGSGSAAPGDFRPYAFLARHVRAATSPAHLILLALAHPMAGATCGPLTSKPNTIRIYRDIGALLDALVIADVGDDQPS